LFLVAILFAVLATLLVIFFTSAATATGSSPDTAISLADGVNTGILGAGQQRWFRIVPDRHSPTTSLEKSLTLIFSPVDGNLIQYISLQLFDEGQLQTFYRGDTSQMTNFGSGQVVARDSNPETGELFWTGWISGQETYYVQLLNDSDFPIDYWLFTENVSHDLHGQDETSSPMPAVVSEVGSDPGNPAPLMPGPNRGTLKPYATYWYAFTQVDSANGKKFQDLNYSFFFTPDDGNLRHHVNFALFSASEVETWWRGGSDRLTNFGAGMLVSRDGDPNTGERIWRGTVMQGETYFLAVENGTNSAIDYWIFDGDIHNPELGPKSPPTPTPVWSRGVAPQTAIPLRSGENIGGLEPGQEIWYSFSIADQDEEYFEEMALTMIVTPDDGNRIRNVTFEVFTANGVRDCSPGGNSRINNVGAGSVVYRDNNPLTGERFWTGWVVDNDLYYVQIRNGTEVPIDYWLFTGDVYRPELGQKP
jgi:hypothetical protein